MIILNRLYSWYGKRAVRTAIAAIIALIVIGMVVKSTQNNEEVAPTTATKNVKSVSVVRVGDITNESAFRVVGTVEAVSEATLQVESSGRITAVNAKLGDYVTAGTVIASIENSSERAALLQAEGAYEATVTQNAQSSIGLDEAEVAVKNVYRDAFATSEGIILNLTDELFSNPQSAIVGFKLDGKGQTLALIDTRSEIGEMLTEWYVNSTDNLQGALPQSLLKEAEENITVINDFVTTLAQIVANQDATTSFTEDDLSSYKTRLAAARATLNGLLTNVSSTRRTYEQASLSASGEITSLSDAQLKSALGTLRAAQANYERTVVRTPISGTINALHLKVGEYASLGAPAVLVANNGLLEIKTAVGVEDATLLSAGDVVSIDSRATGTISRIAPGVNPLSGKIEVRIAVTSPADLKNGSTVGVSFTRKSTSSKSDETIVPINALKMLPSGPVAFSLTSNNTLEAHAVTLGEIRGSMVVVRSGLSEDTHIIRDARGMQEGDKVEVIKN